jgi:hypothetical protein
MRNKVSESALSDSKIFTNFLLLSNLGHFPTPVRWIG